MRTRVLLAFIAAVGAFFACSTPPEDARVVEAVPDRASFPPVAQFLVHRCGTLDCHGTKYRNLRIYGNTGLRLSPTDHPSFNAMTSNDEIDEDFGSVVGLEPEIMSAVVREGGANPERLTFIRKARGAENHKAGTIVTVGDDQDKCMTSWLAGNTDQTACANALNLP